MADSELNVSVRLTGSLLGFFERPLLIHLAKAMPNWVTPDRLTMLGLAGAGVTFVAYALSIRSNLYLGLASFGLILNWFGDSLDGTLARVRCTERPRHGFLVDHTTALGSQILIGLSPFVRFDVACIALIAYLAFVAFSFIKTYISGKLQISYVGIGPTEVRCAIVFLNVLLVWYRPEAVITLWAPMSPIDLAILCASAAALIILAFTALREFRRVALEEK